MDKLLLHSCCAPCSVYCVDTLRADGIEPTSLWFNPNIHPWTEYDARRRTLLEYGEKEHVEVHILEDYGLRDFVRAVSADIDHRCAHCYTIRLGTAAKYAADHGNDMVFLDTAGRLHIDEALMDELRNIKAAVKPNEILLVVDAMTGQDAVNAAKAFDDALGIDGVMLTKLDGDARGGAALSIRATTGKPIKFIGTGEKLDMIELFHPDRMASRILGMGDMLSFIEKAEQQYDEKQAKKLEEKLRKNRLTLSDYLDQLEQLQNMGDLSQIASMLPGNMAKGFDPDQIDPKQFARTKAIIQSMTLQERENPQILNASRKRRIAAGCGQQVSDVNRLLKGFETMQQMTKALTRGKRGMGALSGLMGGGGGMHGFGRKKRLK